MTVPVRERALNQAFAELADSLVGQFDVGEVLQRLVAHVTALVGTDSVGILLRDEQGVVQVAAASSGPTHTLEAYQLRAGQGPGLDCLRSGNPVLIPDLSAAAERWALFAPMAHEHGQVAVHALPMRVHGEVIGAMDLFSATVGKVPAPDLQAAQSLADVATIGILRHRASQQRRIVETAQDALHGRLVLEQAKGMLAASAGVGMEEAFDLLRHFAGYREDRLVEVASGLAAGRIEPSAIVHAGTLHRADPVGASDPPSPF